MHRNDVKKVRFFRDGDANFSGVSVAISRTKYRNFDSLLNDLSRRVPLPFGVRTLHTPGGVHHVYDIDEIEDGKDYVCSTFHSRPIKKIDYSRQYSRESWRPAARKIESQYKSDKQPSESGEKLFQMRNLKPKSITVVAKDDSSNRARVILNRKTAMNYESVLQTISDILQMNNGPVKDLYTIEGKKVGGIADLIHGPDMFLAAARSSGTISARSLPSRLLKKKSNSNSFNSSSKSHAKSAAIPNRKAKDVFAKRSPYTQPLSSRKKEPKVKGNPFVFTVMTSNQENAGTEGSASVIVCGSKGSTGELVLGPTSSKRFAAGSTEEFEVNVGNIGKIQKIRVIHSKHENEAGWHLKEIIMTSVARKAEEYSFPCDQWFSNMDEGDVSLIELPAVIRGKETAKVVNYEVTVMTGEDISAATDSNVFITIFGENCDTGKRWLKKAGDSTQPFAKGSVDVFGIKAVSLKKLKKIIIGHDNSGNTPSWYLEKVLIKDSDSEAEYSFPCRRFLDDEEGDGKTEVTIQAVPIFDPSMDTEQLWKHSCWRFQESSEIILRSAVNGNVLRISDEGEVLADQEDTQHSIFTVSGGGESRSRVFTAKTSKHDFNLALDNGTVTGRKGNPGLLSEFFILPLNDGCFALESVVHRGTLIAIAETGRAKPINVDCEQTKFNVHVKGSLRNLGRIRLKRFKKREIIVETGGNLFGDGDSNDERGEFVVHKIGAGTRSFQSAVTDKFINVTSDEINCKGEDKGDAECQFTIHRENRKGFFSLESVKMPGVFLGIGETGRVKHAIDAGDATACLSVEIISFGEKSKRVDEADHADEADEENYIANDDFEDGDSASGRESSLSNASKHSNANYDDNFEDDESRPASHRSNSQAPSVASSNNERTSVQQGSVAASRAQSAASNVSDKEDGQVEGGKEDQKEDNIKTSEEGKSSSPVNDSSQKEESRPGTRESISRHSNCDKIENDEEENETDALKDDAVEKDDLSRPGTAASKKSLEDKDSLKNSNEDEADEVNQSTTKDEEKQLDNSLSDDGRNLSRSGSKLSDKAEDRPKSSLLEAEDEGKDGAVVSNNKDGFDDEKPIEDEKDEGSSNKENSNEEEFKTENGNPDLTEEKDKREEEPLSEENSQDNKDEELSDKTGQEDDDKPLQGNVNDGEEGTETVSNDDEANKRASGGTNSETGLGDEEEKSLSDVAADRSDDFDKNEEKEREKEIAENQGLSNDARSVEDADRGESVKGDDIEGNTENAEANDADKGEGASNEESPSASQNEANSANENGNENSNENGNENSNENGNENANENSNENGNENANENSNENANENSNENGNENGNENATEKANENSNENANENGNETIENEETATTKVQEAEETHESVENEANEKENEIVSPSDKKEDVVVGNDKEEDNKEEETSDNVVEDVRVKDLEVDEDKKDDVKDNAPNNKESVDEGNNAKDELTNDKGEDKVEKEEEKIENEEEETEQTEDENKKDEAKNGDEEDKRGNEEDEIARGEADGGTDEDKMGLEEGGNTKDESMDDKDQNETGKKEGENEKVEEKNEEEGKSINVDAKDDDNEKNGDGQSSNNEDENSTKDKNDQVNKEDNGEELSLKDDIGDKSKEAEDTATRSDAIEDQGSSENVGVEEKKQVDEGEVAEAKSDKLEDSAEKGQNGINDNNVEEKREDRTVEEKPEDEVEKSEGTAEINNNTVEVNEKVGEEGNSGQDEGVSGDSKGNEAENNDMESEDHDGDKVESNADAPVSVSNLNDEKKNEDNSEEKKNANSQDVENEEDTKSIAEEDNGNAKKEADEKLPAELQGDDDSHSKIAEKETEEEAHESPADASISNDTPAITSPKLSPTPPKTPRNNSAPRRPSSRISNPTASRPNSRSSVNHESVERKAADMQITDDRKVENDSTGQVIDNDDLVNSAEASNGESTSPNERAAKESENGLANEERKIQEDVTEEDKTRGTEDGGEKSEAKKESLENGNDLAEHGDESREGDGSTVDAKGDDEASKESGETTVNEKTKND